MTSRRILLINPTMTSRRSARFPLAVLNLSAALEDRSSSIPYVSTIIDGNIDRDFVSTAVRTIRDEAIDAVGVSVMGGPQLSTAIAASRAIREQSPSTPIIWGGHFPTNCPDATLKVPYVDYAIRAQGEDTIGDLLDALFVDPPDTLASIAGLSWRRGDEIVHNKDRTFSSASLARTLPYARLGHLAHY